MFDALKNYAVFSGRARRSEYWLFVLFYVIVYAVGLVIDIATDSYDSSMGIGVATAIVALALIIPGIAVSFRRLHDTDRSAWWLLVSLLPLIGNIVLLVFFCLDGSPGENRFGPNPKELLPSKA